MTTGKHRNEFWDDYGGEDQSQFWSDYDMWEEMRRADETSVSRDDDLINNVDLALEQFRGTSTGYVEHSLVPQYRSCKGCGQRYGHSIQCPYYVPLTTEQRRADARAAYASTDYKAISKIGRGGPNASAGMKPEAVIVDMDGTVDDYNRPNRFGINWVRDQHKLGRVIVIVTARTHEMDYDRTHKWCVRNLGVPFVGPICRPRTDMRWACDFKKSVYDSLSGIYNVVAAIDDDRWCLNKWRSVQGLEVVEAKPGKWQPDPTKRNGQKKPMGRQ